jgi:hypothetical protein
VEKRLLQIVTHIPGQRLLQQRASRSKSRLQLEIKIWMRLTKLHLPNHPSFACSWGP